MRGWWVELRTAANAHHCDMLIVSHLCPCCVLAPCLKVLAELSCHCTCCASWAHCPTAVKGTVAANNPCTGDAAATYNAETACCYCLYRA